MAEELAQLREEEVCGVPTSLAMVEYVSNWCVGALL